MLKIGITGHRDFKDISNIISQIRLSLKYYKQLDNEVMAITSLAKGADTIFAEAAILENIPLKIILPFKIEIYKNDFKGEDLNKFENIIKNRDFEVVSNIDKIDVSNIDDAYLRSGIKIVDESDIILSVWDGNIANGKGGTGDIVNYTIASGKQLHIIKAKRIAVNELEREENATQELFEKLDSEANHLKDKRFQPTWIIGIVSGLVAVFCFACALSFPNLSQYVFFLSCGEAFFLFIAFLLLTFYTKKFKESFLSKRRSAEYLRALILLKASNIPVSALNETNYKTPIEILEIEKKLLKAHKPIENISNAKRAIWIIAQEQINYHKVQRIEPFMRRSSITNFILAFIKYIFIITILSLLILEGLEYFHLITFSNLHIVLNILKFLWIVSPPIYASIEGIKYFNDWKLNISISYLAIKALEKIKSKSLIINKPDDLFNLSNELRTTLEMENSEWAFRFSEKEIELKP